MKQVFQIDKESAQHLNEAQAKLEYFALFREYVISQVLLKNKDKNLSYDQQSRMFFEEVPDSPQEETTAEPAEYANAPILVKN